MGRGFSLLEVLAALVIVAGAVTAALIAQARSIENVRGATLALEAQALAHELKAGWQLEAVQVCERDEGTIEHVGRSWHWRRQCRRVQVLAEVDADEITLELAEITDGAAHRPWRREFTWLVAVQEQRDRG